MKNYIFKIVIEDDEHEDGRPVFRAYCPALESIGAANLPVKTLRSVIVLQARWAKDDLRRLKLIKKQGGSSKASSPW